MRSSLINSRIRYLLRKRKPNMKIRKVGKFTETPEVGFGCTGLSKILGSLHEDLYDQPVR